MLLHAYSITCNLLVITSAPSPHGRSEVQPSYARLHPATAVFLANCEHLERANKDDVNMLIFWWYAHDLI